MSNNSFRDFVLEQLSALGGLSCRRMFGGHGLYSGEVFLGIPADGRLNFKTNPDTLPDYPACNGEVVAPSEKQILKNYHEVPADILEDAVQLTVLTRKAARP